jgi:hypothetical protein
MSPFQGWLARHREFSVFSDDGDDGRRFLAELGMTARRKSPGRA